MGERRNMWASAKRELDKNGVDKHKLFKKDLGPSLDAYDEAEKATEKAVANSANPRSDSAVLAAKRKLSQAYSVARPIGGEYLNDLKFLEGWASTSSLKNAVQHAEGTLIKILDGMRRSYERLGK